MTFTVCSWDDTNKQVVKTQTTHDCIVIDGENDEWMALGEKDKETWYVVKGSDVKRKVLNIFGTVHLVLTNNSNLSCKHIKLEAQNSAKLHIHNIDGDASGNIGAKNWYVNTNYSAYNDTYVYYYKRYFDNAAAVGGGDGQNMGSLYMHGGTLSASIQDKTPAAIGGGRNGSIDPAHEIVVYAGVLEGEVAYPLHKMPYRGVDVNERENPRGAAIGGSDDHPQGGPITVYGGILSAICNSRGAGIGGGEDSYGGTFKVYGGNVKVERNVIDDKYGTQISGKGGAGIGGGYEGSGGDVHIYGGTVDVVGGEKHYAIGGYDNDGKGSIEIAANMRVTAGGYDYENNKATPDCVFTSAERVPACMYRRWAKIEACDHTAQNDDAADVATTYSIDDEIYHTKHCRYCDATIQEKHADENCACGVADGTYEFTIYEPGTEKNTYVKGTTKTVGAGKKFYLPECTNVPAGYIFKGWEMNPETTDSWAAVKGGDPGSDVNMPVGTSVEALLGQGQTASFYARFIYDLGWVTDWDDNNPTTETIVSISHPDITGYSMKPGNYSKGSLTIDFEDLEDDNDHVFGTHYVARATYILNGYEYTYDGIKDVISLSNDIDNSDALSIMHAHTADVTLKDRTLYKDGKWNTLCLPFNVSTTSEPLSGDNVEVQVLNASTSNLTDGTLTLNFETATGTIPAGTPFIIKWDASGTDITDPVFSGVTIKAKASTEVEFTGGKFVGTYSPFEITEANKNEIVYLGSNNAIGYYSGTTFPKTLHAFRAHFYLPTTSSARAMNRAIINFGDGTTGIVKMEDGRRKMEDVDDAWYCLDGRRLSGQPSAKGIYIHNGRKEVLK